MAKARVWVAAALAVLVGGAIHSLLGGKIAPWPSSDQTVANDPSASASDGGQTAADAAQFAAPATPGEPYTQTLEVSRGDTLVGILLDAGVGRDEAHAVVTALRRVYDPRRIRPGQEVKLTFQPASDDAGADVLVGLAVPVDHARFVHVARSDNDGFSAREERRALSRRLVGIEGSIRSSLYVDATRAGVPVPVLTEMIRAFSWDVDFQRDLQPGDRFEVMFERWIDRNGDAVHHGAVRFAALTLSGARHAIYAHTTPDGETDYYNEKGHSVRKALLRTPIDGARLTSGFGMRNHPILGYSRMHRGVDFGAPPGTPIYAAGSGVVEQSGWNGDYGNYVRIRHTSSYATAYAHLSRYADGVRRGARVRQGQVIGYVGSTGRSTGPHLHYEIIREQVQVNPLSVKMPSGRQLAGAELERFRAARVEIDHQYAEVANERRVADGDL